MLPRVPTVVGQLRVACVAVVGLLLVVAAAAGGLYATTAWATVGLVVSALVALALVAGWIRLDGSEIAVVLALGLLGALSLLSTQWADDDSAARLDAARWFVTAAGAALLLGLPHRRSDARVLHLALVAGSTTLVAWLLLRLSTGDPSTLFTAGGRLAEPVGYVNGVAAVLLMGFWLLAALAERQKSAIVSGLLAGVATASTSLLILTQTRSAIPALLASVVVVLALPRGRVARAWLIAVCLAASAAAAPVLLDVYDAGSARPTIDDTRPAAVAVILSAIGAAIAWMAILGGARIAERDGHAGPHGQKLAGGVLVAGALVAVVGAFAVADPVDKVKTGYDEFTSLEAPVSQGPRYASGGGNRYDLWRIALKEFGEEPAHGVGAGNYLTDYWRLRETQEYVKQPHSLELQVLSELGLLGVVPLALLLGALGWRIAVGLRPPGRARPSSTQVAGAAILTVWLVQGAVDWMHLLPGVTLLALAGVVLLRRSTRDRRPASTPLQAPVVLPLALAVLTAATTLLGVRMLNADRAVTEAEKIARTDPEQAIRKVGDALDVDPGNQLAYYIHATALASLDDYDGARQALFVVAAQQPTNFTPWQLAGDLARRARLLEDARRYYARAYQLNPRDEEIRRALVITTRQLRGRLPIR